MAKMSAGLLLYRLRGERLEVFLVHPGGPFWARKDAGAWSIPKGELAPGEDPLAAARREFEEETGLAVTNEVMALTPIRQKGGKLVLAFALAGDADPARLTSNRFEIEWPPRSGRQQEFPEVDRAGWFEIGEARQKLLASQQGLLEELAGRLRQVAHESG